MGKQEHEHDAMKHEEGRKERKHGGRLEKEKKKEHRKRGGKVEGKKPEHRMDKRARGGRMTPSSPLSGAGKTEGGIESEKETGEKEDDRKSGGRLTASDRNALPASDFALPGHGAGKNGKGHGSFPIPDKGHAIQAERMAGRKSPAVAAKVRAAVHRKYPGIGAS